MISIIKTAKSKVRKALSVLTSFSLLFSTFTGASLFVAGVGNAAGDGWTSSWPAPSTSTVLALAMSPSFSSDKTVLGAVEGGVVRSTDGGAVWTKSSGISSTVNSLVVSPNFASDHLAFALTSAGVFKSTSGGAGWSALQSSPANASSGLAISPNFAADQTVFVVGNAGVFKSTNAGATWSPAKEGLSGAFVVVSPSYASDATVFAGGYNGLYKSTDGGKNWTSIMTGIPAAPKGSYLPDCSVLAVSPRFQTDHMVFARIRGKLYKSTDAGGSWTAVADQSDTSINALALSFDSANNPVVFAGGADGLVKSTDGGTKWKTVSGEVIDDTGVLAEIRSLVLSPNFAVDGTLFVGTLNAGLFKSTDGGQSWRTPFGSHTADTLALSANFSSDKIAFAGTSGGIFKSLDGGVSWRASNSGLTDINIDAVAVSPNVAIDKIVFAGTPSGVFESTDTGSSWTMLSAKGGCLAISPDFAFDQTVFCGAAGVVHKSVDAGRSWGPMRSGLNGQEVNALGVSPDFTTDHTVFAGTVKGGIFKSIDGGVNWRALTSSPRYIYTASIAISPDFATDHTLFASSPGWGAYRSTDGGENWSRIDSTIGSTYIYSFAISPNYAANKTVFAAVSGKGVYTSTDGGSNWSAFNQELPVTDVDCVAIAPTVTGVGSLFAGTSGAGVFRYSTDSTPPTAPKNLAVTPAQSGLNLSWTASIDNEAVASYTIQRSPNGTSDWSEVKSVTGTPPATSYSDAGADKDKVFYYRIRACDGTGNTSGFSNVASGMIDSQPPVLKAKAVTTSASAISVTWNATDTGSGLDRVTVDSSTDQSTWKPVVVPSGASGITVGGLAANTSYYIRVRAYDKQGNATSSVSTGRTYSRIVREETSPYFAWSGSWAGVSNSKYSGGTTRRTSAQNSAVEIAFRGTNVYWIGSKASNYGQANVYIDGVLQGTFDQFAVSAAYNQIIFQRGGLADTGHTLKIVAKGGTMTEIDRVMIDGPYPGFDREETISSPEAVWTGKWSVDSSVRSYSKGAVKYSAVANAAIEFSFTGSSVAWIGTKALNRGIAKVYIDGKQITDGNALGGGGIDQYSSATGYRQVLYAKSGLSNAKHKLKIVVTGKKNAASSNKIVDVDAFVVR